MYMRVYICINTHIYKYINKYESISVCAETSPPYLYFTEYPVPQSLGIK